MVGGNAGQRPGLNVDELEVVSRKDAKAQRFKGNGFATEEGK